MKSKVKFERRVGFVKYFLGQVKLTEVAKLLNVRIMIGDQHVLAIAPVILLSGLRPTNDG